MKRRDALWTLAGAAAAARLGGAAEAAPQETRLTDEEVARLLRSVAGVAPRPDEAARVRAFLEELRPRWTVDPRVQPAFRFEPDPEA